MTRIVITRAMAGICHMQVCAHHDATDAEILAVCNAENPAGTKRGWVGVEHEGEWAPVQCAEHKERRHFMVFC